MPASVDKQHELPTEARNLVFMSSLAMNGEARGIVVRTGERHAPRNPTSVCAACTRKSTATSTALRGTARVPAPAPGDETMIGKIASLATDTNTHRSTLQARPCGVRACRVRANAQRRRRCLTSALQAVAPAPACMVVPPGASARRMHCLTRNRTARALLLQVEVHRLVVFVGVLAFSVAVVLFVIGLIRKMDPLPAFVNGFILVVVANVPEGVLARTRACMAAALPPRCAALPPPAPLLLMPATAAAAVAAAGLPATVTSLLSLTALRLRDRNVLIKRSDIIENLGSATVIASDKTGTLTQNRMTVENVWANMVRARASAACQR